MAILYDVLNMIRHRKINRRPTKINNRCLHKQCTNCNGSGKDSRGNLCIHMISCLCPRCRPTFM